MSPTHSRFTIHLVDPVRARREGIIRGLQLRFEVRGFDAAALAIAGAVGGRLPHAVVFSIRQTEGNGLTGGEAYRRAVGADPMVLVQGTPDDSVTADRRRALMIRHKVDLWVPRQLDAPTMEVLLWNELLQRCLPRERRLDVPATPPAPVVIPPRSFFARLTGAR